MEGINVNVLAALLGRREGTLAQDFKRPPFKGLGRREGQERLLTLAEYALVRLAYEFQASPRSLEQAWPLAAGLAPELGRLVEQQSDRGVYALLLEGTGQDAPREYVLCEGWPELASHVADALAKGWPRLQVANLRAIAQEILVGWCFATGRAEELAAKYRARLDELPPEEIERAEQLLALFHQRFSNRPKPPKKPIRILPEPTAGRLTGNGSFVIESQPSPALTRQRVES